MMELGVGLGIIVVGWLALWWFVEARVWLYRPIAARLLQIHVPEGLYHKRFVAGSLTLARKRLKRIRRWLSGRTFRELPGEFLATLCLDGLVSRGAQDMDLIGIVNMIYHYGTMPQKMSFVRNVCTNVASVAPASAPQMLDLLERTGFEVGSKRRLAIEMQSTHATRMISPDTNWTARRLARAMSSNRIKRATKRYLQSAPPRKRSASETTGGAQASGTAKRV